MAPGGPEPGPDVALTPRELDVLALIAEGASNKAIARRLAISVHTVKFHIASLLDKLDAQWTCPGKVESSSEGKRSVSWASRSDGSERNLKPKPFGWLR